ncbi:MAG: hypothetical protein ACRETU_04520 [Steroidobacterales bacterium]
MKSPTKKRPLATAAGAIAGLAFIGLAATQANAGCMDSALQKRAPANISQPSYFTRAVYRPDAVDAWLQPIGDFDDNDAIVGVWKFKFDGFLVDFGTQAFHVGGTEMIFSAGVDPATGDVCQGAWRRIGPRTYKVNHIAMAWLAPGTQYGLLIHVHEIIKVSRDGKTLTGNYTVDLFNATPQDPFDESAPPFVSGSGTTSATRLSAD